MFSPFSWYNSLKMISVEIQPGWLTYLTAFGSIAAFITAIVLLYTLISNRKKAKYEEKSRIGSEILKWVNDLTGYLIDRNLPPFEQHARREGGKRLTEYFNQSINDEVIANFTKFRRSSVYIAGIAKKYPELQKSVDTAVGLLRIKIRLINVYKNNVNILFEKKGINRAAINIAHNEDNLYVALINIIRATGGDITLLE